MTPKTTKKAAPLPVTVPGLVAKLESIDRRLQQIGRDVEALAVLWVGMVLQPTRPAPATKTRTPKTRARARTPRRR